MVSGVIAVEKSSNKKIGNVSTTYVSQASCPTTCVFMGSGCYAESGMVGMHTRRLNKSTSTPFQLAQEEAKAIDSLSGKNPLRIHVVGDCTTNEIAKIVSGSADKFRNKHNSAVWSYTHGWSNVERESWGSVSVLASCESFNTARLAMARGYAAAIVVSKHESVKTYVKDGLNLIPCPQQTGKTTSCETCKLCWNDKYLLDSKSVIAFATHSQQAKLADAKLVQIGI